MEKLLQEVIKAVKITGDFIAGERLSFSEKFVEKKGLNDLVSYVDKEAERQLISALGKLSPEAGFIAEESFSGTKEKELNWIIDPLDGTTNFIYQIPSYAVSVALVHKNETLLGVVYNIPQKEMFYAHKDGKAYLNGKEIAASKKNKLTECLVATGIPVNNFARLGPFLKCVDDFVRNTHGVRRLGAAAVDLCYVACGRFDAFFEYNLQSWDVAAGSLIVKQAGGIVSDFKGGNDYLFGKEMVAAGAGVYTQFLESIKINFQ